MVVQDLLFEKVPGIPLIQRKLVKYGRAKLTPYERKNYDLIYGKQLEEGWVTNELESFFNWLIHFFAVVSILLYLVAVFYSTYLFF